MISLKTYADYCFMKYFNHLSDDEVLEKFHGSDHEMISCDMFAYKNEEPKWEGLTRDEIEDARRVWLSSIFENADADYVPGYFLYKTEISNKRSVYILLVITGYSFSGLELHERMLFDSKEEATQWLTDNTWLASQI